MPLATIWRGLSAKGAAFIDMSARCHSAAWATPTVDSRTLRSSSDDPVPV
jgi:hypothetical protein